MHGGNGHGLIYAIGVIVMAWLAKLGLSELFVRRSTARRELERAREEANEAFAKGLEADLARVEEHYRRTTKELWGAISNQRAEIALLKGRLERQQRLEEGR